MRARMPAVLSFARPNTRRCSLLPKQSVLIVDESVETRTVLRAALEHPGRRVLEATGTDEALRLAHQFHPSVIVLDVEIDRSTTESLASDFQSESLQSSSIVLLGTAKRVRARFSARRVCSETLSLRSARP